MWCEYVMYIQEYKEMWCYRTLTGKMTRNTNLLNQTEGTAHFYLAILTIQIHTYSPDLIWQALHVKMSWSIIIHVLVCSSVQNKLAKLGMHRVFDIFCEIENNLNDNCGGVNWKRKKINDVQILAFSLIKAFFKTCVFFI